MGKNMCHVGKMTTIARVVMVSYLSPRYYSSYQSENLPTAQKQDVFLVLQGRKRCVVEETF